jgi:PAS domain S-box-containing protein
MAFMAGQYNGKLSLYADIYKAVFVYDDASVALLSLAWQWLDVNEKFCQVTGYIDDELHSVSVGETIQANDPAILEEKTRELLEGSLQTFRTGVRLRKKDSSFVPMCMAVSLVKNMQGNSVCFACRLDEEKRNGVPIHGLNGQKTIFQSVFENNPAALFLLDQQEKIALCNPAFLAITGNCSESLQGKPLLDLVHPEDQDMVRREIEINKKNTSHTSFECRFNCEGEVSKWICLTLQSSGTDAITQGTAKDITSIRRLEKQIEAERQLFSDMFNQAPVTMCFLKGPNQVFENANELYYKFSGRRNIIGKPVREVFPEAAGQGIFELMDLVFNSGQTYTINERLVQLVVNEGGKLEDFYLSFMFQPYRNLEGDVEGIFYFGVDVTEQVVARKKIEESKKLYVDLIQNLPVAVYTADKDGYILLFNKASVALWGRVPRIGVDRWCGSWKIFNSLGESIPHDESPMAICIKEARVLQSEEIKIERPGGIFCTVVAFPSPIFDINGNLTGAVNVLVDISERKKIEEEFKKLSLIARKTINAVIISSPDNKIEWVNEAFSKITGYAFQEAIGRTMTELLHGEKTDPHTVQLMNEKLKKQQPFGCELIKYTKSGQPFWVEIEVQPLFDSNGVLTHYFEIETDITERKSAYEKLLRTENEIRSFARQLNDKLEEERSRLAREIHDEFGQQLTGLKMSLSSLRNLKGKNEQAEQVVNDMIHGVEDTILSLRNFSTELRPGILDTLGLGPSLEWLCREFEKKTGIQCGMKFQSKTQMFGESLSIAFFRICQEALTNVSKHAQATKVEIKFVKKNRILTLTVTDNGKGIQTEKLQDPFSSGLIGMRERARLIGAELTITGKKNEGTSIQLKASIND